MCWLWSPRVMAARSSSRAKVLADTTFAPWAVRHIRVHATTKAAWEVRLLWFIRFGGGDTEHLLEVDTARKAAQHER